tara:strand:+ start:501 stop:1007 length:507 start_codon:yes stop_codon:yes gene_type:complete
MKFDIKKWKSKYLQEKIGFRGPDYADETKDLFSDFQKSVEMLNKEFEEKSVSGDSAEVQEILTTLDDTLSPEFIENLDTILSLIRELPDKPEKKKIGFKEQSAPSIKKGAGAKDKLNTITQELYDELIDRGIVDERKDGLILYWLLKQYIKKRIWDEVFGDDEGDGED